MQRSKLLFFLFFTFTFLIYRVHQKNTKSMSQRPWMSSSTCQTMKVCEEFSVCFYTAWFPYTCDVILINICMFHCICVQITQSQPMCLKFSMRSLCQMLTKVFVISLLPPLLYCFFVFLWHNSLNITHLSCWKANISSPCYTRILLCGSFSRHNHTHTLSIYINLWLCP